MTSTASTQVPEVLVYYTDHWDLQAIAPVADEFAARGHEVLSTRDFTHVGAIGLYACHANSLFDFTAGVWSTPPNDLSVIALHDLGQDGSAGAGYFASDSWHVFDVGILPGPRWARLFAESLERELPGPREGVRIGGWPKTDWAFAHPDEVTVLRDALRTRLGLHHDRPTVLIAASWQHRPFLVNLPAQFAEMDVDLLVKFPVWSSPTTPDHPWADVMCASRVESALARHAANSEPRFHVVPPETPDSLVIALSDVVVSNGSNLMFEAVLAGVPAVLVSDWLIPGGRFGEYATAPPAAGRGMLAAAQADLGCAIETALSHSFMDLVTAAGDDLVAPGLRGRGAEATADAILDMVAN